MITAIVWLFLLFLVNASKEGNLHLLEDEVTLALQSCLVQKDDHRQKRANIFVTRSRIDNNVERENNQYGHERRNTSDLQEQVQRPNYSYYQIHQRNQSNELVTSNVTTDSPLDVNRVKRSEPLLSKPDPNEVDARGIPREAELWERIQGAVSSQQSRAALHDQIRACFQELQSEAEDDGCSYSNKLERCLMLRFEDRKPKQNTQDNS